MSSEDSEEVHKSTLSYCMDAFSFMSACFTPQNQARSYYRYGYPDDCERPMEMWTSCLRELRDPLNKKRLDKERIVGPRKVSTPLELYSDKNRWGSEWEDKEIDK
eukprot:CAMPEP_0113892126 /NCGR_PEP_ID=MMETSP0780_2-20120614/15214_1 /TAXON_ID=652834 /ORGANISM="Palpitomonas bilix" /LENGTH=104 /DNA_ID=CAMNT_0000881971 /DNA_START=63 /DNA_END=377 /DNA_ORIENTATION=+ /assembly_acc=CAM_ASM_000599